jgi:DNA-binding NarL/FixJ family response regulator
MMPVPMVGRAVELTELVAAWAAVASGTAGRRPRTAILTADAGCGKSLLVDAAIHAFDPPPTVVLAGRARLHAPAPYDWLAAALNGLDVPVPTELRRAVRTVCSAVGAGPAVIVVDDLHALDPASLNLVAELAVTPGLPALLLATSRPPDEAVAPALTARTLAHLSGTPGAVRQHLAPLPPAEVDALLDQVCGAPVPAPVAAAVHERAGGNPYWIRELLAAGPTANGLPDHVRRLVVGRLAGLDDRVRRVAAVAATLGEQVRPDELARLVGFDPEPGLRALGALGLLTVDGDGEALRFRPPLVREALATLASRADRVAANGHTARDHLAAGLPEVALRAVAADLPTAGDPLPLLRVATAAAAAAARDAEAADYAERWLKLVHSELDRAAAHRELATALGRLGRHHDCAAHLDAARALLTDPAHPEWARHLAAVAEARLREDRPTEAAAAARDALAAVADDPATEGAASVTLAAALADLDDAESGLALLRTARRAAAERRDLATLGRAVACLAGRYLPHLEEPAAWYAFDEAMATATRFGLEHETGPAIAAGVRLAVRVGDAARARELISARLPLEPDPGLRAWLTASAGLLAVESGDRTLAAALAADAFAAVDPPPPVAFALRVASGQASLSDYLERVPVGFDRRDPLPLLAALRYSVGSDVTLDRLDRLDRLDSLGAAAAAHARCWLLASGGDDEGAVAAGESALSGRRCPAAWLSASTRLTVGRCLMSLGRSAEAHVHGAEAVSLLARWPGELHDAAVAFVGCAVDSAEASPAELTARENEVLSCLVAGMSNKQVARSLGISVRTVAVHVSNLLRKTGSASRTEAALWAVRHRQGT